MAEHVVTLTDAELARIRESLSRDSMLRTELASELAFADGSTHAVRRELDVADENTAIERKLATREVDHG